MKTRDFDINEDYDTIAAWWLTHASTVMPAEVLSHGVIAVSDSGEDLAATFYYTPTNSKVAFLGWTVGNPSASSLELLSQGLLSAVTGATDRLKDLGYSYVMTYSDVRSVLRTYEKAGFTKGSRGTLTDLVKKIG